ncbi:hypothetical protein quinque_012593 [Culex quinquefasciatus]
MIVARCGSELEENLVEGWFNDEDTELLVPELITKYGYQVEGHTVITEDGYVLKMFRILPKRQSMLKRKPVLLVHGVLASSADYVISGPKSSLAYLLSDNGYNVWLANVRGSRYSKEHLRLPVESKEYWDFTWHEIGYYDLPAMIDHVLNVTNSEKLFSQGTIVYFVMTSTRPEYNDKIALMTVLSPAVGLQHVRSPILRFLLNNVDKIKKIFDALNIHEFMPYSDQRLPLVRALCQPDRLVLTYQGHFPQGASVKQMLHHAQVVNGGGRFRQFDYGWEGNWERYGSLEPPAYNLTASTAPVLIYYGLNDWMVHPRDAQRLSKQLPRVIAAVPVADRKFTHMDFMLAKNVRKELYERILPVLEKYDRVR